MLLHPLAEEGGLAAALAVAEAGERGDAVMHESSVANEGHVGAAFFRVQHVDVGHGAEGVVEGLPLGEGGVARGAVEIAGHPGIDDVIYAVPLRRTHQEGGASKVRRGG